MARQIEESRHVVVVTVFAGKPKTSARSAFARHLHAKWALSDEDAVMSRRLEDVRACKTLGAAWEHWGFLEAPYRQDEGGNSLYCTYDALQRNMAPDDVSLKGHVVRSVQARVEQEARNGHCAVLYFPLGLGQHVDHKMLAEVGREMQKRGHNVLRYEEWPYVEDYRTQAPVNITCWRSVVHLIPIERKVKAAVRYTSQVLGLGGSPGLLAERLRQHARRLGHGQPAERIWTLRCHVGHFTACSVPLLAHQERKMRLRDFRKFLSTLRWHDIEEFLPPGRGTCLDVGCGSCRHRRIVTKAGYRWVGLDLATTASHIQGDAENLPVGSERVVCVVLWQVLEYLPQPERALTEASRVLTPGGVLCGSASFLEPTHGKTFYGTSHLLLERLLRKSGFEDIEITPGLSGFALVLWTWLRRYGGDRLAAWALLLTVVWMVPVAFVRFFVSWAWWRMGKGSGHGMDWITRGMPLEFAGHVIFVARKS